MELNRKPLQGVTNIIRFNWPFYVVALTVFLLIFLFRGGIPKPWQVPVLCVAALSLLGLLVSLLVSFFVYDVSDLYRLHWLEGYSAANILTVHAGFDETSALVQQKFPEADLVVCDFYDPLKHTEASIRRARQAHTPFPGTMGIDTHNLPFESEAFDLSLLILSAHEIRNACERVEFFKELRRVTRSTGRILVTEHLRDGNNFLAYTLGFFHFHSRKTWRRTFEGACLRVSEEIKTTPFITTFVLEKHGNSA